MLKTFRIKNYKSILDTTLELGRLNVFIGENGCGKTNLLEALAMASGARNGRLGTEDLVSMGVRVAKPSITVVAFRGRGRTAIADRRRVARYSGDAGRAWRRLARSM